MESYLVKLNQCRALERSLRTKFIKHRQNVILYYEACGADSYSITTLRQADSPSELSHAVDTLEHDVLKRLSRCKELHVSLDSDIRKFTELYKSIDLPF